MTGSSLSIPPSMAPGASDSGPGEEPGNKNPTIPELVLPLRDSFHPSDFDRVEQALILRETNLKNQMLKETADLARLETVKLTEELNALKKINKVSDEDKKVIQRLRSEKSRLQKQNLFLEVEVRDFEKRVSVLEDDVSRLASRKDDRHNGSVVNVENVLDSLIAVKANGNLEGSGKTKLDRVIEKQKEEYAKVEQKHKFEMQKVEKEYAALLSKHQLQLTEKVKVENKLKDCQVEIQTLKEKLSVMEEKQRNGCEDIEQKPKLDHLEMLNCQNEVNLLIENRRLLEEKHKSEYKALEQKYQDDRLELFKVENELKECKGSLNKLKQEQSMLEENHMHNYEALKQKHQSQLLEVENELGRSRAELKELKEERNKLLDEVNKYKKHKDELSNFESQNKEVKNELIYVENEISQLQKFMSANHLGSKNMGKISKNNGMTDGSRNKNCTEIPKHIIDVEALGDSMPANVIPQRNAVGNSGTSKSSYAEAILLSDSDDDCDPGEPEPLGLKRKRTSSPNAIDINNCGHHSEEESIPTAQNKQRRMLGRCHFVVGDYRNQNSPSTCDQEMSKQRPSLDSPAKVNGDSDSSSSSKFSSDGSDDDGDINLESAMRFITNQA